MGQVFGYSGVEEPAYTLVWQSTQRPSCEVRLYKSYFVAQVACKDNTLNDAFYQLANYIGVFGAPQNIQKRQIAMTAPVVTGPPPAEKIAMTAPVVSNQDFMQFILPHTFTRLEDIPTPQDDKILIKQIPEKVVAVSQFSGANDASYFVQRMKELKEVILEEEFVEKTALGPPCPESVSHANDIQLPENIRWSFAKYNPPFTLPPFRRNEVWVELPKEIQTEKLHALVEKASAPINPATTAIDEQTK